MCIKKKEKSKYVDPDRELYRKFFNIEDDYLIEYLIEQESDEGKETGYIVYIDPENDIDWKVTVPAIWKNESKNFIRKAFVFAQIFKDDGQIDI